MKFFVIFLQLLAISGAFGNETNNNSTESYKYYIRAARSSNGPYPGNPAIDIDHHIRGNQFIIIKKPINSETPMTGMFEVNWKDKIVFDANYTNQLNLCNNYTKGSWEYFVTKIANTNLIDEDDECDLEPGKYSVTELTDKFDLIVPEQLLCGRYIIECYLFWNKQLALVPQYTFYIHSNCIDTRIPKGKKYPRFILNSEQSLDN